MDIKDFYRDLLEIISPWEIMDITMDKAKHEIRIGVSHASGAQFACSSCGELCSVYDHGASRVWRHLDICQYKLYLEASLPRTSCKNCGVKTARSSWSGSNSRFTDMLSCRIIDTLQVSQSQSGCAMLLDINRFAVSYLMKKSVILGESRRKAAGDSISYLAIDEKSYKEGHHYVTILSDADNGRVLEVVEHRTIVAVQEAYKCLTIAQLSGVKAVSMDMWSAFESVTHEVAPQAAIVHDKFHLSGYLNNAVDITRRAENKQLLKKEDTALKGTKYMWLKGAEKRSEKETTKLRTFEEQKTLKTLTAFQLKEEFKAFFLYKNTQDAKTFFEDWFSRVGLSLDKNLLKVATMFKEHYIGIQNYIENNITNAIAESLNSKIQTLKAKARGFFSAQTSRIAILFHFGKLNLYP